MRPMGHRLDTPAKIGEIVQGHIGEIPGCQAKSLKNSEDRDIVDIHTEEGPVRTEVENGVMQVQAKECQELAATSKS